MMRMIFAAAALATLFGLSGCAGMRDPTPEQQSAADYGRKPTPKEATALIRAHLGKTLTPPAAYQLKAPTSMTPSWSRHNLNVITYGYLAYYSVNIKNSAGSYTGPQHRAVFIRDGRVMKALAVRSDGALEPE
ncbi:hypothetical protein OL229_19080 [Neisseriaceae bacterium JH1-16]|nr:hypothetical protein [Neisseriaceae bacterium JH1-16]